MTTTFGLFAEGLIIPTIDDIRQQFEGAIRDRFGSNFPLGETGFAGFLVGSLTERLSLLYEALQQIRSERDPDAAVGASLRALGLLTGTISPTPLPSTVVLTLCGDDGTLIPQGLIVQTPDTLREFATAEDVTLTLLPSRIPSTSYSKGDRFTNSLRCYECTSSGETDGTSGPTGTGLSVVDGTATISWIGDGVAAGDVSSASVEIGPIVALARGLTDIKTPVFGLNTCTNLLDAEEGNLDMTDEDFRLFRDADVSITGTRTSKSLRSKLSELSGVQTVTVFENNSDATVDGVPPHSIEVMVQGGDDQQIRDIILANLTFGIGTTGTVSGTSTDDEGRSVPINFSRPILVPVYVDVTLTKDPFAYVGDAAVKAAVEQYGLTQPAGFDVVASRVQASLFKPGVIDIPRVGSLGGTLIGVAPGPTSDATISIDSRHLATYSAARVTVHSSDATL